jgi:hypothetical protein
MPKKGWITGPELVGQIDGISQNASEDAPWYLIAGVGECAAVDGLGIGPKSATPRRFEKFTRFDVHTFAFPAGSQGENEGKQLRKGKLAVAGEIRVGLPGSRINISWNQVEKIYGGIGKLA